MQRQSARYAPINDRNRFALFGKAQVTKGLIFKLPFVYFADQILGGPNFK